MQRRHALHSPWPAGSVASRVFVVFPFPPAPSLFGGSGTGSRRSLAHHRRGHRSTRSNAAPHPLASDTQRRVGRIYVPLRMHPWVMQACHSTAFCHLGTARILRMLERFYWWIGKSICTRWWLRNCFGVPSTENAAADGPVAHHYLALARRARHRRQHRLFRPSPGDASRKYLHLAFH